MTNSMTAFSRCDDEQAWGSLVWELRSVNHRYLDVAIKLPEELRSLENSLRQKLATFVRRGKIECYLRYKPNVSQQSEIAVNETYARAVLDACQKINKMLHQPSEMNVIDVLKWPGVIVDAETDLKPVLDTSLNLFEMALKDLIENRKSEGQRLQKMLQQRCSAMAEIIKSERNRRPQLLQQTRDKLLNKLQELNANYEQDRLEQELVYIAQKMDVDEELDRMESHFSEVEKILNSQEPIGRRLDFIMQEFNREANTLGSKSTDIQTTRASVELKVLIEQMREQVQNIE